MEFVADHPEVKPSEAAVYQALLYINNRTGWKERFGADFITVKMYACITNNETYYKALNKLREYNLIEYQKGRNQHSEAIFRVIPLYEKTDKQPTSTPDSTVQASRQAHEMQADEQHESTVHIHKHINNKHQDDVDESLPYGKSDMQIENKFNLDVVKSELLQSDMWIESSCMSLKIKSRDELFLLVDKFILFLRSTGTESKSIIDFKTHFHHWVKKGAGNYSNHSPAISNNKITIKTGGRR